MKILRGKRGEPLAFLILVLMVWIVGRLWMWTSPFAPGDEAAQRVAGNSQEMPAPAMVRGPQHGLEPSLPRLEEEAGGSPMFRSEGVPWQIPRNKLADLRISQASALPDAFVGSSALVARSELAGPAKANPSVSVRAPAYRPEHRPSAPSPERDNWSAYAWLYGRESGSLALGVQGARPASYGASQAGAWLRYSLPAGSQRAPFAYVRASKALVDGGEEEGALGLGMRPIGALPVSLHGEMRVTRFGDSTKVRPAAFAVTELPPLPIAGKLTAEVYGQAGYIGGAFATPFADGQVRVTRRVISTGTASVSLGAGAWGGAQKGAARADIGPSAAAGFTLAGAPVRLSVDYRLRVAGNAEPGDGVAITLSSGF